MLKAWENIPVQLRWSGGRNVAWQWQQGVKKAREKEAAVAALHQGQHVQMPETQLNCGQVIRKHREENLKMHLKITWQIEKWRKEPIFLKGQGLPAFHSFGYQSGIVPDTWKTDGNPYPHDANDPMRASDNRR